jgi:hypothetical protein
LLTFALLDQEEETNAEVIEIEATDKTQVKDKKDGGKKFEKIAKRNYVLITPQHFQGTC